MTPVATLVGQSGPPHRIITLPHEKGCGSSRTQRAQRMKRELIEHAARTRTWPGFGLGLGQGQG